MSGGQVIGDDDVGRLDAHAGLLERGWPCRAGWAEEERVHDEVARRLVPLDALHRWLVTRELDEAQVEAWHVAEEFHVPEDVAARGVRLLLERIRRDVD